MKHRRLILLLAFILILITVLRETGIINLNYYRSSINSNTRSYWTNYCDIINDTIGCPKPNDTTQDETERDCIPTSASQIAVVTYIASKSFRDNSDSCSILILNVSNDNDGLFWTPLYKNVNFDATAICGQSLTIRDKSSGYKRCKYYHISGTITVTGTIRVTGLCSYYEVKKLILKELINTVHKYGRTQLENL
jgi:hypothetical protein